MNTKELRSHSSEKLQEMCDELSKELFDLTNQLRVARTIDAPHTIRDKRRMRARIKTLLREKQEHK
jgi:ribosomal protein L29